MDSTEDVVVFSARCPAGDVEDPFVSVIAGGDTSAAIVLEGEVVVVSMEPPEEYDTGTIGVEGGSDADGGSKDGGGDVSKELGLIPGAGSC